MNPTRTLLLRPIVCSVALAATLTLAQFPSFAAELKGNAAAGQKKTAMCQGCHGIPGTRSAYPEVYHVPLLGGQHPAYLAAALAAYKKGERTNTTMRAIAAQLTDQDMADLAAYYGQGGSK